MPFCLLSTPSLKRRARWLEWCSTMDLLAAVGEQEGGGEGSVLSLYRLSWETVWEKKFGGAGRAVTALAWSTTGHEIALGFSNGTIVIISTAQGQVIRTIGASSAVGAICRLVWSGEEFGAEANARMRSYQHHDSVLPSLSKLPAKAGGPYSQSDLEWEQAVDLGGKSSIHHPSQRPETDLLVALDSTGRITFHLYGRLSLGNSSPELAGAILNAVSHPNLSTVYLLDDSHTILVLDNPLLVTERLTGLRTLALSQMELEAQLDYLTSAVTNMAGDASVIQPSTLAALSPLEDAIRRQGSKLSPFGELLRLLATGSASPAVSDWLLQRLGVRGISKFEAGVKGAYESLRRSIRTYIAPILERILISLIDLEGRSRWTEEWAMFGLDPVKVDNVIKTVKLMLWKCQEAERSAKTSINRLTDFCKWLQAETARLLRSDSVEETTVPPIDYRPRVVLDYLKYHLGVHNDSAGDYIDLSRELASLDVRKHDLLVDSEDVDALLDHAIGIYGADEISKRQDLPSRSGISDLTNRGELSFITLVKLMRALVGEVFKGVSDCCSPSYSLQEIAKAAQDAHAGRFVSRDSSLSIHLPHHCPEAVMRSALHDDKERQITFQTWTLARAGPLPDQSMVFNARDTDVNSHLQPRILEFQFYNASTCIMLLHAESSSEPVDDEYLLILTNLDDQTVRERFLPRDFRPFDRTRHASENAMDSIRALAVNGRAGREVVAILGRDRVRVCLLDMAEDEDDLSVDAGD